MKILWAGIAVLSRTLATAAQGQGQGQGQDVVEPDWTHKPSMEAVQDVFPAIPLALGLGGSPQAPART